MTLGWRWFVAAISEVTRRLAKKFLERASTLIVRSC